MEVTRRALVGGLGGAASVASRSWLGLAPRLAEVANEPLDGGDVSVFRPAADGGFLVAGSAEEKLWLARLSPDGTPAWSRTHGGRFDVLKAEVSGVARRPDGGYVVCGGDRSYWKGDGMDAFLVWTDERGRRQSVQRVRAPDTDPAVNKEFADSVAVAPDGSAYLAGFSRKDEPEEASAATPWVAGFDADGRQWFGRLDLPGFDGGMRRPGFRALAVRDGGLQAVFRRRNGDRRLGAATLAGDGSVRDTRVVDLRGSVETFRPTPGGYLVGREDARRDEREGYEVVHLDRDAAVAGRTTLDVPWTVGDVAPVPGGDYLVGSVREVDFTTRQLRIGRYGTDGNRQWVARVTGDVEDRTDVFRVAATRDRFATVVGQPGKFLAVAERDGGTLDPLLALAGGGLLLTAAGAAVEVVRDE